MARLVYVYSNGGADDVCEIGPVTIAQARAWVAQQDTDSGRIAYFTVPASRRDEFERSHTDRLIRNLR